MYVCLCVCVFVYVCVSNFATQHSIITTITPSPPHARTGLCCEQGGIGSFSEPKDKCQNRCCDNPAPIMFWVQEPKWDRGSKYSVRSGNGDPAQDPSE